MDFGVSLAERAGKGAKTQAKNFQEIDLRQPRRDGLAMKNLFNDKEKNLR